MDAGLGPLSDLDVEVLGVPIEVARSFICELAYGFVFQSICCQPWVRMPEIGRNASRLLCGNQCFVEMKGSERD
ncbi:MAG: hypothetical protein M2R45_04601 [Verrucomicrobia subdivision 3 bacterium]|nr:hypothetical protein [Limisphaerales bacterium]MCS1417336.1 hypothetical protein [Limisphaerales bacterium]